MTQLWDWPEALVLDAGRGLGDEREWQRALDVAQESSQRVELSRPIRFGENAAQDIDALRFLRTATERYSMLRWQLDGDLPWPLRTVAHLCPPAARPGDPVIARWRSQYKIALCTYRIGPNFVSLRDRRPDGRQIRATLDESWVTAFQSLTAADRPQGEQASQVLAELAAAGLALLFDNGSHFILPTRLRRWPVPYTAV